MFLRVPANISARSRWDDPHLNPSLVSDIQSRVQDDSPSVELLSYFTLLKTPNMHWN